MAVKRERPESSVPGELHTRDGRTVRIKLPPELQPPTNVHPETRERPRPDEPPESRSPMRGPIPPFAAG